ncbi:hypothetical protein ABRY95_04775 [Castellaniella ginsengisoli]|uniref:Uncharacterized protein n=1 Tax=Castellaniella ginsengisoli TaxID=546114 RepID=A0AB39G7Z3_9BURK
MANRIAFAYYLNGWSVEDQNIQDLRNRAAKILPNEFTKEMEGHIYCPACYTTLSRSPREKAVFSNNRAARFIHLPRHKNVKCDLRTRQAQGKTYINIELARKAIENDELAIIDSFMRQPPAQQEKEGEGIYDDIVEDIDGPITDAPLSRHNGEKFSVPSKITTVAGICRRFDRNLYKYYLMPGSQSAVLLQSLLVDIRDVKGADPVLRLYWGIIKSSFSAGADPNRHLRMTELHCNADVKDFYIKAIGSEQLRKGISEESVGRIIIFWGSITVSGIGLCLNRPGWGEYALLPEAYAHFLRHE